MRGPSSRLGWQHAEDGALLSLAATQFDVFLTVDKDLPYQQNVATIDIAVIVLRAQTTRLVDLRKLLDLLDSAIRQAKPREIQILSWRDLF